MRKIGEELERMHPSLYINVTRQITRPSNGELQTVDTAPAILSAIARDLFRSEITWSKVNEIIEINLFTKKERTDEIFVLIL